MAPAKAPSTSAAKSSKSGSTSTGTATGAVKKSTAGSANKNGVVKKEPGTAGPSFGSGSSAGVRMSQVEIAVHDAILACPRKTITQADLRQKEGVPESKTDFMDAINGLLRKNLITLANKNGEAIFVGLTRTEAKELGTLEPEEKLVLDHIRSTARTGMWTRTLKAKTGLHQNVISRAIKLLEQKRLIKAIKNVKYTTRKIYMDYNLDPSSDVTGGPWYTGADFDVAFVEQLQMIAKVYIRKKSFPDGKPDKMFPLAYTPYLPTAQELLAEMYAKDYLQTDLDVDHLETLLETLVWDGEIEKLWVKRYPRDGKDVQLQVTYDADGSPQASLAGDDDDDGPGVNGNGVPTKSKKRKAPGSSAKNKPAKKKRRRTASTASDDIDEDSNEDNEGANGDVTTDDEKLQEDTAVSDDEYRLPPPLRRLDDDQEHDRPTGWKRPGPAGNDGYWVYRTCLTAIGTKIKSEEGESVTTYPQVYELGVAQTPCGICPVAEFCYNRGQPRVIPLKGERDLLANDPVQSSSSSSLAAKARERQRRDLLKMKVPSGNGEAENSGGVWTGGGKVGGKIVAPVNPANCKYYAQWFGETIDW